MADVALGTVLEMQGVLVSLHVPLAGKHFVANVTRKLSPLALMDLRYVNPQILLIAKVFVAHATFELFDWSLRIAADSVLLCARHGRKQELGHLHGRSLGQDRSGSPLGRLRWPWDQLGSGAK